MRWPLLSCFEIFQNTVFLMQFIAGVALSGGYAIFEYWRRATFLLGLALLWLTVVRLTCDSSRVGVLAVRSRRFDATFTGVIGALMAFLAYSVDALGS